MANLTLRSVKGSPLTNAELDGNFEYFTGSHAITGSLIVTGGITGSLLGTATTSNTSSYVTPLIQTVIISGSILISGSIIPSVSSTSATSSFNLGSPSAAWKDIYVSNGTINFLNSAGVIQSTLGVGNNLLTGYTLISGSLAQGQSVTASGLYSHAEGFFTTASGVYSHAEGQLSRAVGDLSHAEGYFTLASGAYSHAEGYVSQAVGYGSHAEGNTTVALGDYSHVEGYLTVASGSYQHVMGVANTRGDNTSLLIVGNGNNLGVYRDAFKVRQSGSIVLPTTQSAAPSWTGVDGEMVFATVTGNHYFYVWMSGTWRSGSLS